jgi:hypothetical protein
VTRGQRAGTSQLGPPCGRCERPKTRPPHQPTRALRPASAREARRRISGAVSPPSPHLSALERALEWDEVTAIYVINPIMSRIIFWNTEWSPMGKKTPIAFGERTPVLRRLHEPRISWEIPGPIAEIACRQQHHRKCNPHAVLDSNADGLTHAGKERETCAAPPPAAKFSAVLNATSIPRACATASGPT